MSAFVAIVDSRSPGLGDAGLDAMVRRLRSRGADRADRWRDGNAVVAVVRAAWEMADGFAGGVLVGQDDDLVVAADATFYYVADLERKLASSGVRPRSRAPSHLILAAYRAWGDACVEHLEGDYAFVVWDRRRRRMLCARDFGATRPLFYALLGGTLVVASTLGAVLAHPACEPELDEVALAAAAAALFAVPDETVYRGVKRLPPGHTLTWEPGVAPRVTRVWEPPLFVGEDQPAVPFDEAAAELRALLVRATEERLDRSGPTALTMSGGWDSPAVFGAGQEALRLGSPAGRTLVPVSMSFPEGDTGREDETIAAIAAHWRSEVHWVDIRAVPMFDRLQERIAARDEPFAHPYETFNRALARRARETGARVCLNGVGGDALFQASAGFLADLLRRGRLRSTLREWQSLSGPSGRRWKELGRWGVLPLVPRRVLRAAGWVRETRPMRRYLDRLPPPWLADGFARRVDLAKRELAHVPPRRAGEGVASYEASWMISYPFFWHIFETLYQSQFEEGVELRSPLFDERVLRFAATRPRVERNSGGDVKRLLRAAMRGLLPDEVLAPRADKTGTLGTYFGRSIRENFATVFEPTFDRSLMAQLGIFDARQLVTKSRQSAQRLGADDAWWLMFALATEIWLQQRTAPNPQAESYDSIDELSMAGQPVS